MAEIVEEVMLKILLRDRLIDQDEYEKALKLILTEEMKKRKEQQTKHE